MNTLARQLTATIGSLALAAGTLAAEETALDTLEAKILAADRVEVPFEVTADSPHGPVNLKGKLVLGPDGSAKLEASGVFFGRKGEFSLQSDHKMMTLKGPRGEKKIETPKETREALLIGLTRMGILHNLAQLSAGFPPDHSAGGVKEWVVAKNVKEADGADLVRHRDQPGESRGCRTHHRSHDRPAEQAGAVGEVRDRPDDRDGELLRLHSREGESTAAAQVTGVGAPPRAWQKHVARPSRSWAG